MTWGPLFADRADAGERLAARLHHLQGNDTVVVGLPRGGVPVAAVVAELIDAPLDVIVVRKLGAPGNAEYAIGAIGEDGVEVLDAELVAGLGVTRGDLTEILQREQTELHRRVALLRGGHPRIPLVDRVVAVIDDGLATGATAKAACRVARAAGARRIVLAVPCAPPGWEDDLADVADELICLATPEPYFAVNQWYRDFRQVHDDEVVALLAAARSRRGAARGTTANPAPGAP